jgi:hypothetical protein
LPTYATLTLGYLEETLYNKIRDRPYTTKLETNMTLTFPIASQRTGKDI